MVGVDGPQKARPLHYIAKRLHLPASAASEKRVPDIQIVEAGVNAIAPCGVSCATKRKYTDGLKSLFAQLNPSAAPLVQRTACG